MIGHVSGTAQGCSVSTAPLLTGTLPREDRAPGIARNKSFTRLLMRLRRVEPPMGRKPMFQVCYIGLQFGSISLPLTYQPIVCFGTIFYSEDDDLFECRDFSFKDI